MIMTSRPRANTQKYLEGCNFAISVPKNSLLKYDFQFCAFFISLLWSKGGGKDLSWSSTCSSADVERQSRANMF